jgi:uncharacterized protein YgiM (DUF1202 family)
LLTKEKVLDFYYKSPGGLMAIFKLAIKIIITTLSLSYLFHAGNADALLYTIRPEVILREGPGQDFRVVEKLKHNQTLIEKEKQGQWIKVRTLIGLEGFVNQEMVSHWMIKISLSSLA